MRRNITVILVLLFSILSVSFFLNHGCEKILTRIFVTPAQPVCGAIEIGNEWKEIIPPSPLKPKASQHFISLKMNDSIWRNAYWDTRDSNQKTIKYGDGKCGKIEAFLYDSFGRCYELEIGSLGGGFDLYRKSPPLNLNELPRTNPNFPTDRVYVKIRIRSDINIFIDKIEWCGNNPQ